MLENAELIESPTSTVRALVETQEEAAELLSFARCARIITTNPLGRKYVEIRGALAQVRSAIIDARAELRSSRLILWEPSTANIERLERDPRPSTQPVANTSTSKLATEWLMSQQCGRRRARSRAPRPGRGGSGPFPTRRCPRRQRARAESWTAPAAVLPVPTHVRGVVAAGGCAVEHQAGRPDPPSDEAPAADLTGGDPERRGLA